MGQVEQWQILAEEAAQEKDPALTRALDESHAKRNGNGSSQKQGAA